MDNLRLLFIVLLILCRVHNLRSRTKHLTKEYDFNEHHSLSDQYPSCVDIVDVWPPPRSVLSPIHTHAGYADYVIKFTFSRPITDKLNKSYITLSVSTIKPLNFQPFYLHARCRSLWVYFRITDSMLYIHKINIIIDGGLLSKEISRKSRDTGLIRTPTTVVGGYYFGAYLQSHTWFRPPDPQRFRSLPFCLPGGKRTIQVSRLSNLDGVDESKGVGRYNMAAVHSRGHLLTRDDESGLTIKLLVSLPLMQETMSKFHLHLPSVVHAKYSGYDVLVELPKWTIVVSISGRQYHMYSIPVRRELVYELRERIHHNQYKKVYPVSTPSYVGEWYGMNFPKFSTSSSKIYVRDYYGPKKLLDNYYKVRDKWVHVSRVADIKSRLAPDALSHHLSHDFQVCPADSHRNSGRQGSFIVHVVEYGSYYHRLVPEPSEQWSKKKLGPQVSAVAELNGNDQLGTILLDFHPVYDEVDLPSAIKQALSKYFCVIPALVDLPNPPKGGTHKKFYPLEKCIFVPKEQAESRNCEGLQLFRNIRLITENSDFCDKNLGDCIGAPITSIHRFPVVFTYGLQDLTGFIVCGESCVKAETSYSTSFVYPNASSAKLVPRSSFVLTRKHGEVTSSSVELIPEFSREHYFLSVPVAAVLKPAMPQSCSEITVTIEKLSSSFVQTVAVMAVTISNKGKGSGVLSARLKCSESIYIHPSSAFIKEQIKPESNLTINFLLDTRISFHSEETYHKCEVTMILVTPFEYWELSCPHYFTTHYGRLNNPCHDNVPSPIMDLVAFVLPKSEVEKVLSLKLFLKSPAGTNVEFVRGVTLAMEVPAIEQEHIWIIDEVKVECVGRNILILSEDELLFEASSLEIKHRAFSYYRDFTRNRRVFFFSSNSTSKGHIGLCSVQVIVNHPNGICVKSKEVIQTLFIPVGSMDQNAIVTQKNGLLVFMSKVYGKQTVMVSLVLGINFMLFMIFCCVTCGGLGCRLIVRRQLPTHMTLHGLLKELNRAKEKDKKYWGNPQVYITSGIDARPYNAHFVLHDFKTTDLQPLNNASLKGISMMGELRYESKKMPVMFGHIKRVFVDADDIESDVWLVASSGVYLLKHEHVAPEYRQVHSKFLKTVHNPT